MDNTGFRHRKLINAALVALFVVLVSPVFLAAETGAYATDGAYAAGGNEGMRTPAFDVDIDVRQNNSFLITERISVEFLSPSSGITREIPLRDTVRMVVDGESVYRDVNMRISRIEAEGGPYKAYREDNDFVGKQFIRIGSPDKLLEGRHDYVVRYLLSVDTGGTAGGGALPNRDFIRLSVIPQSWPTAIDSSTIRITLPKAADFSGAEFIGHKYGGAVDDADLMDVRFPQPDAGGAYAIVAKAIRPIDRFETVTFFTTLPEGYFAAKRYFSPAEIAFFTAAIAAPLICLLLWFLFGRSSRIVETVEFRPPEGLTPAETGLFWNGRLRDRDLYSMVLYWAGKGVLDIEETADKDFVLYRKAKELPTGSKAFERNMFDRIFDSKDMVSMKASALSVGKAMHSAWEEILREYRKAQNLFYEKRSQHIQALAFAIACLPIIFNTVYAISAAYWRFDVRDFVPIIIFMGLFLLFSFNWIGEVPSSKTTKLARIPDLIKSPAFIAIAFLMVISVVVIVIGGAFLLHTPLYSAITAVSTVPCIIFAVKTRKRTEYYIRIIGQIRGFANFIKTAESDRIKRLVDENPDFYFELLPYAWAMGLTDEWDGQFNRFGLTVIPPSVVVSSPLSALDIESATALSKASAVTRGRKRGGGNRNVEK